MNNDLEKELKELQIQYDKVLKERNELEKENKLLKKDLEVLEIIKKWSFIKANYKEGFGIYDQFICNIHTVGMEEDFLKVEGWFKNDK